MKLWHQGNYLISFKWDDFVLTSNAKEACVQVPKRQATQIGQRPFKDARRFGISPVFAMARIGNGR
jgi:hypothetical protein